MDTRYETDEWYAENLLKPLATERSFLEGFRKHNSDALPTGFMDATSASAESLYEFALAGVPVLPGYGKSYGDVIDKDVILLDAGIPFLIAKMSSSAILDLRKKMDVRSGDKVPAIVETPSVGLVIP